MHDSKPEWLAKKQAAQLLVVSLSTIERKSIPWQDASVPKKIRTKWLILAEGGRELPRYYHPDVEALLSERPHSAFQKLFGRHYERHESHNCLPFQKAGTL